jgi:DNA-binding transcriptional regulator LsrR (DeoR family)
MRSGRKVGSKNTPEWNANITAGKAEARGFTDMEVLTYAAAHTRQEVAEWFGIGRYTVNRIMLKHKARS